MDYIEAYINEKRLSKSERTITAYRYSLRLFERYITPTPLENASKSDIVRYFNHCMNENRVERSTTATYQNQLNAFYKWMFQEGHIKENPLAKIDKIKYDMKLPIFLTVEEIKRMLEVAKIAYPRDELMISVMYATGVRVSELVGIKKKDMDWSYNRIKVFGKGAKERTVEVPAPFMRDLEAYSKCFKDDQRLFNYHPSTVEGDIRKIRAMAEINKKVTPHKLRHSFATHMIQNNGNVEAIRKLLGHTSLNTTQRYMHLGEKEVRAQCDQTHPMFKGEL
jgi:site-specific recombinase XerD